MREKFAFLIESNKKLDGIAISILIPASSHLNVLRTYLFVEGKKTGINIDEFKRH